MCKEKSIIVTSKFEKVKQIYIAIKQQPTAYLFGSHINVVMSIFQEKSIEIFDLFKSIPENIL